MALPASGAIALSAIQTTMGGANPASLSEYYRGGAYVPNIATNNAIPLSGAIAHSNFYSAVGRLSTSHTITIGSRTYIIGKVSYTDYGYRTIDFSHGSLSPTTFSSTLGTTTIRKIYHDGVINSIVLQLNKSTNTDLNFYEIVIGATTLTRSTGTFTDLGGGIGQWIWSSGNIIGTTGTQTLTVRTYA